MLYEKIGLASNNGPGPDCPMNDCLQCDEDNSGPMFAKYAGRTRRNTGLESCITRPCELNKPVVHEICPVRILKLITWDSWQDLPATKQVE
jgi:hypothetical protein